MPILASALGDTPETVIAWYLLWTGNCNAWCVGSLHAPSAVVVQAHLMPDEPTAFGSNAAHIAEIIPHIEGWESLLVPAQLARDLERPIATAAGTLTITTLEDIYYVLEGPVPSFDRHPAVRLLTPDDEDLLGGSDAFTSNDLGKTIIAGAVVNGEIVSLAHTFAWSPDHVDIGVMTHEDARGQGFATTAAALVADEILKEGRVPVWSCGASNEPSIRIAARLGFREISRKVYIIPQKKEE
jgi:GNAT superfamily N-acetyltransferase